MVVVPFEIKLPSWKSADTGLPRVLGAVKALTAVTCILQVGWARLREVNGQIRVTPPPLPLSGHS